MSLFHKKFSSLSFMKKPLVTEVEGYPINSLGFCPEDVADRPVLVFIGGAFQTFFSFKKEAQILSKICPVLLVDLPGQGSNTALCPELDFPDFARLLAKFLEQHGVKKIVPVGLSYGSGTAYYFAQMFPEMTDSLILGGTTLEVRESYRYLLEETIDLINGENDELFCQGAVMNLINYSKREITKIPERIIKGFYKNMQSLSDNCRKRYVHNTRRLLDMAELPEAAKCKTLVFTGQYDNFTTPFENYQVSKRFENSEFLLIADGDHLANLEKREVVISVYHAFLTGRSWSEVEGIIFDDVQEFKNWDRRIDPRLTLDNPEAELIDQSGKRHPIKVRDINHQGIAFDFLDINGPALTKGGKEWYDLNLKQNHDLPLSGYLLNEGEFPRMIFRRGCFEGNQKLENFVSNLA